MLNSFPVSVIIGAVLGFLSGLGVGGGSLLMLWLTLVLGFSQETAKIMNLMFFLPAAVTSCLFHFRRGGIPFGRIFPAVFAGCVGVLLFSKVGVQMDNGLLQKLFGFLLLFTGIRELRWKPQDN